MASRLKGFFMSIGGNPKDLSLTNGMNFKAIYRLMDELNILIQDNVIMKNMLNDLYGYVSEEEQEQRNKLI